MKETENYAETLFRYAQRLRSEARPNLGFLLYIIFALTGLVLMWWGYSRIESMKDYKLDYLAPTTWNTEAILAVSGVLLVLVTVLLSHYHPIERLANFLTTHAASRGNPSAIAYIGMEYAKKHSLETTQKKGDWEPVISSLYSDYTSDGKLLRNLKIIVRKLVQVCGGVRQKRARKAVPEIINLLRSVQESAGEALFDSQYVLGLIYLRGPIERDTLKASSHLRRAHEGGHIKASCELGILEANIFASPTDSQQILQSAWRQLPSGKLKMASQLELARLELREGVDEERSLVAARLHVESILGISVDSNVSRDSQQNTPTEQLSVEGIEHEAKALRQVIDARLRSIEARKQHLLARDELYSFITHSIPSALTTVKSQTESSLGILRDPERSLNADRARLIRSLSGALGRASFIEDLLATHKLLVAGKDQLRNAWIEEGRAPERSVCFVLVDAIKQAIAQAIFAEPNFRQLGLPPDDDEKIDTFRSAALHHLNIKTKTERDVDDFREFLAKQLPFIGLDLDPTVLWPMTDRGIRLGVFLSIVSELMRNAMSYRPPTTPLDVSLVQTESGFHVCIENNVAKASGIYSGGTKRGLTFIREFSEAISSLVYSQENSGERYRATLEVSRS